MRNFPFQNLRPTDDALRKLHRQHRVSPRDSSRLRAEGVAELLAELMDRAPARDTLVVQQVGRSVEGRPLQLATIGRGPVSVLAWTQMHGDESTHTAVVLDLLSLLIAAPGAKIAGCDLLERLTLHVVPMLNPDGAERGTRHNAQGVDVNRDARDLATPEGRVLHKLIQDLRPQFGFNLHNQSARSVVGESRRVAAASVLAPPLDEALTETDQVRRAKQLSLEMFAVCERSLPGHASRYDAGYMPRAFGDWCQAQGVATMLLEAGGWPGENSEEIVELHFVILLQALLSIASGRFADIDAAAYEDLPLNGEHNLLDVAIRRASLATASLPITSPVDIGIHFANGNRIHGEPLRDATFADLGDLEIHGAKLEIDGRGLLALPAGIAYDQRVTPCRLPSPDEARAQLAAGTAILVGRVDAADNQHLEALKSLPTPGTLVHVGFIADLDSAAELSSAERVRRMQWLLEWGVGGFLATCETLAAEVDHRWLLRPAELEPPAAATWQAHIDHSRSLAQRLGWCETRGLRGRRADLVFVRWPESQGLDSPLDVDAVAAVIVDGHVVYGRAATDVATGRWMRRDPRGTATIT